MLWQFFTWLVVLPGIIEIFLLHKLTKKKIQNTNYGNNIARIVASFDN